MNESRLESAEEAIQRIREQNIANEKFGPRYGTQDAEEKKIEFCEYVENIISLIRKYHDRIPTTYLDDQISKLMRHIDAMQEHVEFATTLGELEISHPTFGERRDTLGEKTSQKLLEMESKTLEFERVLRVARLEDNLPSIDELGRYKTEALNATVAIEKLTGDSQQILGTLEDRLKTYTSKEASANFATLSTNHKWREHIWHVMIIVFFVLTVVAFCHVAFGFQSQGDSVTHAIGFFQRLLIVTAPIIFFRVALTKYNQERNLRVIYDHRNTTLELARLARESLKSDDKAVANQIYFEILKLVFENPDTGFTKVHESTELNVNSVFSSLQKGTSQ